MNIYNGLYLVLSLITLISYLLLLPGKHSWLKFILAYLALLLVTFLASVYLANIVKLKSNLFIFHISTPLEFIILSFFYRSVIVNNEVKKGIAWAILFFIVISVLLPIYLQSPNSSNPTTLIIIESIVLIFLSLFFLREVLILQHISAIHRFPPFWIVVGILFYYTGSIIIEGMLNYMIHHSMELAARIFRIGYIFKYLLFVVFLIGAFCRFPSVISLKKKN